MIQNNNFSETYHSERQTREHILVCLSSAPSNLRIVQTGARMSEAFHGTLTALYVQTPDHSAMSEENQNRLQYKRNSYQEDMQWVFQYRFALK